MSKDDALKEVLAWLRDGNFVYPTRLHEIIKEALAQPEQEPVSDPFDCGTYVGSHLGKEIKNILGDCPPQRTWVGLTEEEREEIALEVPMDAVCITEAKLKEKNT